MGFTQDGFGRIVLTIFCKQFIPNKREICQKSLKLTMQTAIFSARSLILCVRILVLKLKYFYFIQKIKNNYCNVMIPTQHLLQYWETMQIFITEWDIRPISIPMYCKSNILQ